MDKVVLNNGFTIPTFGGGTFPFNEELLDTIPQMKSAGYTMIDTSDNYNNEQYIGEAFSQMSKEELESLIVITKYSDPTKPVREAFLESSKRIYGKSCLPNKTADIYLIHWPYPHLWKERWHEMEELHEEGLCKAIGVCNFTNNFLYEMLDICKIVPAINQFECHPMFQQRNTINICEKNKIAIMSYSPLARMNKNLFENDTLRQIAYRHNINISQVIINWNIMEGRIPIPASKNDKHIIENIMAVKLSLSKEEIEAINTLECGMRIRFNPETRFSEEQISMFLKYKQEMSYRRMVKK